MVGDFVARQPWRRSEGRVRNHAGIVIETRANGSSGIVRDDYFDWPKALPDAIAELKPAVIVVSLGANDRQMMRIGDVQEKFRTDAWTEEYRKRVNALATLGAQGQSSGLWVGMPPFQSTSMTADMVTFNGIYREEVEKVGGRSSTSGTASSMKGESSS